MKTKVADRFAHGKDARRHRRLATRSKLLNLVRIKQEKSENDVVDLMDSEEEREQRRIAGRFTVRPIHTDEGTRVEFIEFLSDDEEKEATDDDEDQLSDASTLDLGCNDDENHSPRVSVARPRSSENAEEVGLLYDYERIYIDLTESSSSDDYESTDESNDEQSDAEDVEYDSDTPRAMPPRARRFHVTTDLKKQVLMRKINRDIEALEAQKPWRFVYRCLTIPFEINRDTDTYGFVFERWDEFWSRFGRAVWERNYWKFIPPDSLEYMQRKNRQSRAAKAFAVIAEDLHQRFGIKLVQSLKMAPHPGWWYRTKPPINLMRLYRHDCRLDSLHLSRFRERWPYGVRHVRDKEDPMWWRAKQKPVEIDD